MLPYFKLLRLPNVFTALADVALGFAIARGTKTVEPGLLIALLGSSAFLYLAGMVLNDVWDVDIDRKERPQRPIPSGQISLSTATALGFGLLVAGVIFGWLASIAFREQLNEWWKPGLVATALAAAVVSYDRWVKHTLAGPLNMGFCRFLNVLLGASATAPFILADGQAADHLWFGFERAAVVAAAGLGIYIMGVTIFAKHEAGESNTNTLLSGTLVMLMGLVVFALAPMVGYAEPQQGNVRFWLLIGLLSIAVFRRAFAAISDPRPQFVQAAVKQAIISLILYDAAMCWMYASLPYAIAVVALIVPAILLGRWIYST